MKMRAGATSVHPFTIKNFIANKVINIDHFYHDEDNPVIIAKYLEENVYYGEKYFAFGSDDGA
jgi:hypothetical protein